MSLENYGVFSFDFCHCPLFDTSAYLLASKYATYCSQENMALARFEWQMLHGQVHRTEAVNITKKASNRIAQQQRERALNLKAVALGLVTRSKVKKKILRQKRRKNSQTIVTFQCSFQIIFFQTKKILKRKILLLLYSRINPSYFRGFGL